MAIAVLSDVGASRIIRVRNQKFEYMVSRAKFYNLDGIPPGDSVANAIYNPLASQDNPRGTLVHTTNHVFTRQEPGSDAVSFEVSLNHNDHPSGDLVFGAIGFYVVDGSEETMLLHLVLDSQITKSNNRNNLAESTFAISVPFVQSNVADADVDITRPGTLRAQSRSDIEDVPNANANDVPNSNLYAVNVGGSRNDKNFRQVIAYKESGVSPEISNLWGLSNFWYLFSGTVANYSATSNTFTVDISGETDQIKSFFADPEPSAQEIILQNPSGRLFLATVIATSSDGNTITFTHGNDAVLNDIVSDGANGVHIYARLISVADLKTWAHRNGGLIPFSAVGGNLDAGRIDGILAESQGGTGRNTDDGLKTWLAGLDVILSTERTRQSIKTMKRQVNINNVTLNSFGDDDLHNMNHQVDQLLYMTPDGINVSRSGYDNDAWVDIHTLNESRILVRDIKIMLRCVNTSTEYELGDIVPVSNFKGVRQTYDPQTGLNVEEYVRPPVKVRLRDNNVLQLNRAEKFSSELIFLNNGYSGVHRPESWADWAVYVYVYGGRY